MKRTFIAMAVVAIFFAVTVSAQAGETYTPCKGNLIVNGNFESGNTEFESDYMYVEDNANPSIKNEMYAPKTYSVGTNPNLYHNAWASFRDHSSGAGNMLIVNAACVSGGDGCDETTPPSKRVWEQTVPVTADTTYVFSYYVALSYIQNPPLLQVSINDTVIGTYDAIGTPNAASVGEWRLVSYTWNSGSATSAKITIVDQRPVYSGDDYALDDIELCGPCVLKDLIAGQQTDVGSVSIKTDGTDLYVTYKVDEPWCFTELHLAVGYVPQTKKGNPIPGQFPYSYYPAEGSCETSYTFPPIPIPETCPAVIAAHAAVQKPVACPPSTYSVVPTPICYQYETAWGNGTRFVDKGNWGMWFDASKCVSCTLQQ